jgi:hypothetical protein
MAPAKSVCAAAAECDGGDGGCFASFSMMLISLREASVVLVAGTNDNEQSIVS